MEDHPFEYKDFSGIIPEGNYGAGRVEIWDDGTYLALNSSDSKDTAHKIREGFAKGHITIILSGKRLNGEFAFIRLKKAKNLYNGLFRRKSYKRIYYKDLFRALPRLRD